MRTPSELSELLRSHGRKVTPQRQRIFQALQHDQCHPSAERIYDAVRADMETISLKTVYQTLHDLAALGEIAALDLGTGAVRFDPNVERSHHHLVCRSCGEVRDVFVDVGSLELPRTDAQGYDVGSAEVVFRGCCPACRRAGAARAEAATGTR
ncbi:MAG: Fur family transcriptional regulator [Acidimicrobiales bacterium]